MMEAIILAGGKGSRLQSIVKDVPKPMADIGGRPFLEHLLIYLARHNVKKVVLSVGYKYEVITNYFHHNFRNMEIIYAVEDEPLGTGGALVESLKYVNDDHVLLMNGDTSFEVNLEELFRFHMSNAFDVTMSLKLINNFNRYGTVDIEKNKVVGFEEKGYKDTGYINGGVYALKSSFLDNISHEAKFSFETDLLQKHIRRINVGAYISAGYFIDIGVPEDYEKAQRELRYQSEE